MTKLQQSAVDPSIEGSDCGKALLRAAELWARERGLRELALDTPAAAGQLIALYRSQGLRAVEELQWPGKSHCSAGLSKPLDAAALSGGPRHRMPPEQHTDWCGVMVRL